MNIKFKNLKNSSIKIESPISLFGLMTFIEMCNEYKLEPRRCGQNGLVLSQCCNVNGCDFEYVECLMVIKRNGQTICTPHVISYWNGHYLDFTFDISTALNMLQDEYEVIQVMPDKIIPLRRYNRNEIIKAIRYVNSKTNEDGLSFTFTDDHWWINNDGKICPPKSKEDSMWMSIDLCNDGIITPVLKNEYVNQYVS